MSSSLHQSVLAPLTETRPVIVPLFSHKVPAGFPSPADDYIAGRLSLDQHLIQHRDATFFVRAKGNSMVGAGIFDGSGQVAEPVVRRHRNRRARCRADGEASDPARRSGDPQAREPRVQGDRAQGRSGIAGLGRGDLCDQEVHIGDSVPIALVDCNNFYVTCERVFDPGLEGKPVVVLSNNDGCAVACSNEVKALGIKMGDAPGLQFAELHDRLG